MLVKTYGKQTFFKNIFKSRKGWLRVYPCFRGLDLNEEEQ
jgi:hypothetical protein